MVLRLSFLAFLLLATLISIVDFRESSPATVASRNSSSVATSDGVRVVNPVIERGEIRVQLLELSRAHSPNQDHQVTSALFLVEYLGSRPIGKREIRAPIRFADSDGKEIPAREKDCPKSGSTTHDFRGFRAPWHVEIPAPENPEQTILVRQWICREIPATATAIHVAFGREKELIEFQFELRKAN